MESHSLCKVPRNVREMHTANSRRSTLPFCYLLLIVFTILAFSSQVIAQAVQETGFVDENYINAGSVPMGFVFAPDGRMFVWYKQGLVKIYKNAALVGTFLDIQSRVNTGVDRGLVGFALDPDFATNGFVYVGYVLENAGANTSQLPRTERVSRFTVDATNPNHASATSEKVLLGTISTPPCSSHAAGSDCIPNDAPSHTVDHLLFGPDGKLYISIGDGAGEDVNSLALRAQDLNSYAGKILRVNPDGTAPTDNPFYDGTNSIRSKVYDYGVRNPFRFTFDPSGELVVGDVGWFRLEEFHRGKGLNFGWPCFDGDVANPEYQSAFAQCRAVNPASVSKPIHTYPHTIGSTVIAGPYYTASAFPAKFLGNLFYGDFAAGYISRLTFDAAGTVTGDLKFDTGLQGPTFLGLGPDNALYYVAIKVGQIRRIRFTGATNQPPVAQASANPRAGLSPLDVNFSSAGSSDPENDPLTFSWDFGDGTTSTLPNPVHRYTSATGIARFTATLTVKDPAGLTSTATVPITVGDAPPVPTITSPANGITVNVGNTVTFTGSATDPEDGVLPPTSLTWNVILHHNTHIHQVETVTGASGNFIVENHDPASTFSYEIQLTATDSAGVSITTSVTVNVPKQLTGCTPGTVNNTMTVCSPAEGAALSSPITVSAAATSTLPITAFWIYDNGKIVFQGTSSSVNVPLTLANGTHQLAIQAWNTAGTVMKAIRNITVGGAPPTCTPSTVNNTMTICTPAEGATVTSPVHIVAKPTSSLPITRCRVYDNSLLKFDAAVASIDTNLAMATGSHQLAAQCWNTSGVVIKAIRNINVP